MAKNSPINITAIYAPNMSSSGHKNEEFWQTLNLCTLDHHVDILLGNFNITKEAADRVPPREDIRITVAAVSV